MTPDDPKPFTPEFEGCVPPAGVPSADFSLYSIAVSLKRLADAVAGTELSTGIHQVMLEEMCGPSI